ncbi:DUF3300 domain-containing protein [Paraburkholderia humisilvae]|uniref:DUF3300 domain-containing protein n=1 Tax=Paraburkholderia humisilvae TaxID=627669 RepID=A0A6J5DDU6_9BURK|nr:DUF3300 domain-containing protein [Paraburkholderia humisilvae]CAB3751322.1 hypothetical protein LMG29542_01471 [Paraburkholderia humisilvae]
MTTWNERRVKAVLLWLILLVAAPAFADRGPEGPAPYKPEEIEALVAPIALYPDSVLAQVLMASTYPLEIVHAARWVKENPNVKGDAAVQAVQNQSWDASVKSLVAFPQVLEPMYDKLDWTQKLGDAFLAQQKDVFAAVQRLRARAQEAGNLKSNEQQQVITDPAAAGLAPVVRIEPTNPDVIYVPAYNPTVVYGAWSYPAYPPYYWPPYPAYYPGYYPGAALATGFAWGLGIAAAGAIFADCNSCWGGDDVNINYDKAKNVDRNFDSSKIKNGERSGRWQHDAGHRQGVAYRDNATRDKFAGSTGADRRSQYRGRAADTGNRVATADRPGAGNRAANADRRGAGNRASVTDRSAGVTRAGTSDRSAGSNLNRASANRGGGYGGGRDSAFSGVGASGSISQRNFDRGNRSMQGSGFNRPSAGGAGMRGGGGRGGRR